MQQEDTRHRNWWSGGRVPIACCVQAGELGSRRWRSLCIRGPEHQELQCPRARVGSSWLRREGNCPSCLSPQALWVGQDPPTLARITLAWSMDSNVALFWKHLHRHTWNQHCSSHVGVPQPSGGHHELAITASTRSTALPTPSCCPLAPEPHRHPFVLFKTLSVWPSLRHSGNQWTHTSASLLGQWHCPGWMRNSL